VGVMVHWEVSQPCTGVGVHNNFISTVDIDYDVLAGHAVLVVVLMVLVKDGSNLLTYKNKDSYELIYSSTKLKKEKTRKN